jgi:hypothetical protein
VKYAWIFDSPALAGHATGASRRMRAGLRLPADDPDFRLTVPVTCLLEAYSATPANSHYVLDSLVINPGVVVESIGEDPHAVRAVGHLTRDVGRPGAAHAAQLALTKSRPGIVFIDLPMPDDVMTRPV